MNTSRKLRALLLIGMIALGLIGAGRPALDPRIPRSGHECEGGGRASADARQCRRCGAPHIAAQLTSVVADVLNQVRRVANAISS